MAVAAASLVSAQFLVSSDHQAEIQTAMDAPVVSALPCRFVSAQPTLDYALRMEASFSVDLQLGLLRGSGTNWDILLRVTPEGGQPVFLMVSGDSREGKDAMAAGEFRGGFAVGEGAYRVDALLRDYRGEVCKGNWRVQVNWDGAGHALEAGLAHGTVAEIASVDAHSGGGRTLAARVTVLLHAASFTDGRSEVGQDDAKILLSSLRTLLERLHARSMRVVIFNAHRTAPLFEKDDFQPVDLTAAAKALDDARLAVVNQADLRNWHGSADMVAKLLRAESSRPEKPDAFIIVGPKAPVEQNEPRTRLNAQPLEGAQLFYFQYAAYRRPPDPPGPRGGYGRDPLAASPCYDMRPTVCDPRPPQRGLAPAPDAIAQATKAAKGTTIEVHEPQDLAGAVRRVLARLDGK